MTPAPLPPGVYFDPSPEECVRDYLRPWIESGCDMETPWHGAVFPMEVYKHRPGELRVMRPPGHVRGFQRKWYFLTQPKSKSRRVATGGNWKLEQKKQEVEENDGDGGEPSGGKRRSYGFYLPDERKTKTPWLMVDMAADEEGGGKGASVPAVFCKIYVSPRADNDERRAALGEDCVAVDGNGQAKPACVEVHGDYFSLLAERLPAHCVRVDGGHQGHPPGVLGHQAGQVAPPPDFLGNHYVQPASLPPPVFPGLHHAPPPDFLGHHYVEPAPLPPPVFPGLHHSPPPVVPGYQQQGQAAPPQDVLAYEHGMQVSHPHGLAAPPPQPAVHGVHYVQVDAPPNFVGHYHGQDAIYSYPPAPMIHVPAQHDEEEIHVEKMPRLTNASPVTMDSMLPTCKAEAFEIQEQYRDVNGDAAVVQEPGPVPTPPQGPRMASPSFPVDDALPPQPPAVEFNAFQAPKEPSCGGSMDLSDLTHVSYGDDFGMSCQSQLLLGDGDDFDLDIEDILHLYDGSWIDNDLSLM